MASRAKNKFEAGDVATKRRIIAAVGSNLTFTDRKLNIDAKIPFRMIADSLTSPGEVPRPIEPESDTENPSLSQARLPMITSVCWEQDSNLRSP